MNKRLREIERESGLEIYGLGAKRDRWEQTMEKFAELIARECISVVENVSPGYQDYRDQIEDAFREACVQEIKQHFRIEE